MKIAYLVYNLDDTSDTSRSVITQANAMAAEHDVRILSIARSAEASHHRIAAGISVDYLLDLRDHRFPTLLAGQIPEQARARELHQRESAVVPGRWDRQFTALGDVAMQATLPGLEVDVAVTVTPGLLAAAITLLPEPVAVVHQEHHVTSARATALEPLLTYAPQADLVTFASPAVEDWLQDQLGALTPPTSVVPTPLPQCFAPRSRLDQPLLMAAGRLVPEKQFPKLISAFADIAAQIPDWRLRIYGEGPQRLMLVRQIRRSGLWDRVELPGAVGDMASAWAKASVAAITSSAEGLPLVAQDAMAAGVPVVSFDCASGPREIIQHDVNGLLVGPQSMAGLSAALLQVATDVDLRSRLGEGALRTARQYDAGPLTERWVGLFAEAVARRGHRGRLESRALTPNRRAASPADSAVGAPDLSPAAARHEALAWCAAAAEATGDRWWVIPAHQGPSATVVVPMRARDAFLSALAGSDAPTYLSLRDPALHGWHERRGTLPDLSTALRRGRTSLLHVEPWPEVAGAVSHLAQGCTVDVEFWEVSVAGELVSPRRNDYTDRLPLGGPAAALAVRHQVDEVDVPTLPLLAAPSINECRFPVDVVYTWVDGRDAQWAAKRDERLTELTGTAHTRQSSGRARYLDHGELRYSLRSIDLFAPWVRHIYLVTAGQTPPWLDDTDPRVRMVDHAEILTSDALPTFNSHAIETSLHRIEGLAEHFIYFNDDFLLGRPLRPEAFFTPAGLPRVFATDKAIGLGEDPDVAPFLKAAANNRALVQRDFGLWITHNLAHAPYAHRVSTLEELWRRFPDEMATTARSPFRSDTDVSTLSSLAQHLGLAAGTAVSGTADLDYLNLGNPYVDWQLSHRTLRREQDFICLGDDHDQAVSRSRLGDLLADFYQSYFPVRAPWEKD